MKKRLLIILGIIMCSLLTGCSGEETVESRNIEKHCDKAINIAEDYLNHYKSSSEARELLMKTYDECKENAKEYEKSVCSNILDLSMEFSPYSTGTTYDIKNEMEDLKKFCY